MCKIFAGLKNFMGLASVREDHLFSKKVERVFQSHYLQRNHLLPSDILKMGKILIGIWSNY